MGCCESKGLEAPEFALTYSSFKVNESGIDNSEEEFQDISLNSVEDINRRSFRKPINDIFSKAQVEPAVFTQRLSLLRQSRVLGDSTNNESWLIAGSKRL
jgi:hypothetical protein